MSYIRAEEILPTEIIEIIQQYVEGQNIYIPRKSGHRTQWGSKTRIRKELEERNRQIVEDFRAGDSKSVLATRYFLSEKSIQRIVKGTK